MTKLELMTKLESRMATPRWIVEALKAAVVSAVLRGFCAPNLRWRQRTLQHKECGFTESAHAGRLGSQLSSPSFLLVMIVGAAQERHLVEYVLLEPFEPEINDWSHKERY